MGREYRSGAWSHYFPVAHCSFRRTTLDERYPPFGTVAGSPLSCQEVAPEWCYGRARSSSVVTKRPPLASCARRRAMRRGTRRIWPAGAGRPAHGLDERHQDLICDLGEQIIGRRSARLAVAPGWPASQACSGGSAGLEPPDALGAGVILFSQHSGHSTCGRPCRPFSCSDAKYAAPATSTKLRPPPKGRPGALGRGRGIAVHLSIGTGDAVGADRREPAPSQCDTIRPEPLHGLAALSAPAPCGRSASQRPDSAGHHDADRR